ncbi:orotidine-5'-phosphate decarboxylase [Humibacillus xanthopallidus]|uniref:Orotidine-5'-phosphate decarboxylase n=1 Tax=Humibacillus xanthopallidus TaxID=412689 RepID=A0A543HJ21_9MICO|nr:orotidine-5'-phosphate decarboxylase [Humibacillus xanthopallidus]TQM58324.1 orotidine-5'-phosphate decarboxylase [Humibacillus xanthopallidus]
MTDTNVAGAAVTGPGAPGFGPRLQAAMRRHGPLCAGLDPHRALIEQWGLTYDVAGLERFALTCVEAYAGRVAAVKPQSAFFEVFGSRGIAVLERVLHDLRDAETLTILDAKRGDIGSTMTAYAEAFLGPHAVAPADALTVSPYLGYESLRPAIDLAAQSGRGLFVLALTSNPEGSSVQHAVHAGRSVAASVVEGARGDNAEAHLRGELGHVGLVIGATVGDAVERLGLDLVRAATPVLAPGFGAQGGTADSLAATFGPALDQVLASSSRELLAEGPDPSRLAARTSWVAGALAEAVG